MSDVDLTGAPVVAADTLDLYEALGPIPSLGYGDASLGFPLLRYLDGLGQIMQRINDLAVADSASRPGWSRIVDVTRCPTYALPWLAQLVGVRFDQTTNTDATQRAAIRAEQGFNRGTPGALQAAAAKWLKPGQLVSIYERDTDPYHFTVVITLGQLAAGSYSQVSSQYATYALWTAGTSSYDTPAYPESQITAALEAQKPAGLVMAVTVATGATYSEAISDYSTYTAWAAAKPTYALAISALT